MVYRTGRETIEVEDYANGGKSREHLYQESRITYLADQIEEGREELRRLMKRRDEAIRDCYQRGTTVRTLAILSKMTTGMIHKIVLDLKLDKQMGRKK